eukprot:279720-Amphidinium_carterae.1
MPLQLSGTMAPLGQVAKQAPPLVWVPQLGGVPGWQQSWQESPELTHRSPISGVWALLQLAPSASSSARNLPRIHPCHVRVSIPVVEIRYHHMRPSVPSTGPAPSLWEARALTKSRGQNSMARHSVMDALQPVDSGSSS